MSMMLHAVKKWILNSLENTDILLIQTYSELLFPCSEEKEAKFSDVMCDGK